jgi:uncharacterized membrane protein
MTNSNLLLALAFGIGVIAGLRALTAPTAVAWAGHLHWLNLAGTHLAFMGSIVTVVIFTLAAIGEIVNDKLPKTPPRTALPSVIIRMVMGALAGATLSVGFGGSLGLGALCGAIGALAGTYLGYFVRMSVVKALHSPDFVIALLEDAIAVGGGFFLASRL